MLLTDVTIICVVVTDYADKKKVIFNTCYK